ncbi:uncharacterized protein LOC111628620 [Centruroides sculpturatus]|uniref:uncharacterized protein LOC111628620 n=1 Tax=Centruroides sculpturatus TaxID=218467 RepID=UPI000C6CE063|nr:uncharacterized protein LOC111628620 [Centruroides sculpturatus]
MNDYRRKVANCNNICFPKCLADAVYYNATLAAQHLYESLTNYYNSLKNYYEDPACEESEQECLPCPDKFDFPVNNADKRNISTQSEHGLVSNSVDFVRAPFPPCNAMYADRNHPTIFSYAYLNDGYWLFAKRTQLSFANEILIPYPFKDKCNRIIYPLSEIELNYVYYDKKLKVTYPFALQSQVTGMVHYIEPFIPDGENHLTTILCGVQDTSSAWNYFFFPVLLRDKLTKQLYRTLPFGVRDSYGNYLCIATSNTVFPNNNNLCKKSSEKNYCYFYDDNSTDLAYFYGT